MPDNPYDSPTEITPPRRPAPTADGKPPFSHQAAKFSLYAPLVVFMISCFSRPIIRDNQGTDAGRQLGLFLAGLSVLLTVSAFTLGIVGLVGGVQRSSVRIILMAGLGVLLNACMLGLWIWVAVMVFGGPW